jgi:hypothetical protein
MEPIIVRDGSWTDLAADFAMAQKVLIGGRIAYRIDPGRTDEWESVDSAWRGRPVEEVAAVAVDVIGEVVPPQRWQVPEADAVATAVSVLEAVGGNDAWRGWFEWELISDVVGAVVGFPFREPAAAAS